ncbi:flagellar hook-associated protein FlgK [Arenibaculum pallidiluteum]|uniref:flagellar hook-associated protein FlgK n=1 Tax=Arenibaculum pallidiluteum TaxID=2812559 RepID=UPI001A976630|nr:flagellar hook-associated protein FlgK [Arenibaculum pallidiluteum]
MGLDVSLRHALSGLGVAQKHMEVVSRNISNTDTPGYTRKVAQQATQVVNGQSYGVDITGIQRTIDQYLQKEVLRRDSDVTALSVTESYLKRVEELHGSPTAETSLASQISKMRNGFLTLADSPDSELLQQKLIDDAQTLAHTFNQLSKTITDLRNQAHQEIISAVGELNANLGIVADLNKNISAASGLNVDQPDLEDKRDIALREIANLIDVNYYKGGDGAYGISTGDGRFALLEGTKQTVSVANATLQPSSYYGGAGTVPGIMMTAVPAAQDVTGSLQGGKIGALIELRDETLPKMQAQLDELAQELALRFSMSGVRLFAGADTTIPADNPVPVTPPSLNTGFAAQIQVPDLVKNNPRLLRDGTGWNASPAAYDSAGGHFVALDAGTALGAAPPTPPSAGGTDPGPATKGDSSVIRNLLSKVFDTADPVFETSVTAVGPPATYGTTTATFENTSLGPDGTIETSLPLGLTLGQTATELVSWQANERARVTNAKTVAEDVRDHFDQRMSDQSGVNLDEEISLLVQLQRSYSSAARVITTNREMFSELIQLVG